MKQLCSRCTVLAMGVLFLVIGIALSAMAWRQSVSVQLWVTTASDSVLNAAFRNPDGSLLLIAYNNTKQAQLFKVRGHSQAFHYILPVNTSATFRRLAPAAQSVASQRITAQDTTATRFGIQ